MSSYTELQSLPDYHIPLIIGDENNHLYAFDGAVDDIRLYSRALSDAEIEAFRRNALMKRDNRTILNDCLV